MSQTLPHRKKTHLQSLSSLLIQLLFYVVKLSAQRFFQKCNATQLHYSALLTTYKIFIFTHQLYIYNTILIHHNHNSWTINFQYDGFVSDFALILPAFLALSRFWGLKYQSITGEYLELSPTQTRLGFQNFHPGTFTMKFPVIG